MIIGDGEIAQLLKNKWYGPSIKYVFIDWGVYTKFDYAVIEKIPLSRHVIFFSDYDDDEYGKQQNIATEKLENKILKTFPSCTVVRYKEPINSNFLSMLDVNMILGKKIYTEF